MASRGINKVILVGNLGADPEIRYSQNGVAMATLSIATSEMWKDKQTGEQRENTEWHRCVIYRRLAEVAGEYLRKGSKVYVEGKLQTRKWQGQDGKDNYTTEIVVNEMQMLDSRGGNQQGGQGQGNQNQGFQGQGGQQVNQQQGNQQGNQNQGFQNQQSPQQANQQQGGQGQGNQNQGFQGQQQSNQQQGNQQQPLAPDSDFDDDIPF